MLMLARNTYTVHLINSTQENNAYWSILGKVHLQYGRWALDETENVYASLDAVSHFVRAAEYFDRYKYRRTHSLAFASGKRFDDLFDALNRAG